MTDGNWVDFTGNGTAQLLSPLSYLAAGESVTVDVTFQIAQGFQGSNILNVAEIGFASEVEGSGINADDIDSSADASSTDTDVFSGDNTIDNSGGDEDDHDPAGIEVDQVFDLALVKVINTALTPAPYSAGDKVSYIITVYNQGTLDATNVVVEDYLPAGLVFNQADNATFAYDSFGNLEAKVDFIAAGDSKDLGVTLQIDPNYQGTNLVNNAEITGAATTNNTDPTGLPAQGTPDVDSTPGNNELDDAETDNDNVIVDAQTGSTQDDDSFEDDYDLASVNIDQVFDLALVKKLATNQDALVQAGDVVTYAITVYNQGSIDAIAITIKDYIPQGMTLVDADWNADGTYTIPFLAAQSNTTVNIDLLVSASFEGTSITNFAEISDDGNGPDDVDSTPDGFNLNQEGEDNDLVDNDVIDNRNGDEDDHDLEVIGIGKFDLALDKKLSAAQLDTVNIGDIIEYEITITNEGDFAAYNIEVLDHIPDGMMLSTLDNNNWILEANGSAVNTIAGPLNPGQDIKLTILLEILPTATSGSLRNVAEIANMTDETGVVVEDVDSELENDGFDEAEFDFEDDEGAVGVYFAASCPNVLTIPAITTICEGASQPLAAIGIDPNSTYKWDGPTATLSCTDCPNPVASPTVTSTYCVTAEEPNGCKTVSCSTLNVEPNPNANAGSDVAICGGSSAQLSATGGNAFSWSPTTGLSDPNVANPIATPSVTTEYCVLVINALGCIDTDCITVTVGGELQPSAGQDVSICKGSNTQLSAIGGVNYQWSPAAGLSSTNTYNPIANPSTTTTYCVTVTDGNGCQGTDCVTVNVNNDLAVNAGQDKDICKGSTAQLSASGGSQYTWSPAAGLNNANSPNPTASPQITTTYCVTATDNFGCSGVDCITVIVNEGITISAGNDEVVCANQTTALSASGGVSYVWSPSTGLNNSNTAAPLATVSSTTNYCVTVTDASGCTGVDCVTLLVNDPVIANAGADVTICENESTGLNATGGLSYRWSPATGLSNANIASPVATPTFTTNYCVTVTNQGCTSVDCVTVKIDTACDFDGEGNDPTGGTPSPCGLTATACPDKYICDDGIVRLVVNGGSSWTWSPATGLDDVTSPAPYASPSQTTTYTVVISDNNGCTDTDEVVVYVDNCNATPVCNLTAVGCPDKYICGGGQVRLVVNGGSSWLWSPATGLDDPTAPAPYASPSQTTTYTITVKDDQGCTSSDEVVVFVSGNANAFAGNDASICSGGSTNLNASGGSTYQWSPAAGLSNPNSANPTASPSVTTAYTVEVTTADGCKGVDHVTVYVNGNISVNAGNDQTICTSGNTQLNASGGGTYQWSPAAGLNNPNIANPMATPSETTTYCVTVTSADGCSGVDCVTVYTSTGRPAVACEDKTICFGGSTPLNVTSGAAYNWSPAGTLDDATSGTPTANPTHTTTYNVTVTDDNGCNSVSQVTVFVEDGFLDLGQDISMCSSVPVQLTATGGGTSYQWSPVAGLSNPNIANPIATPLATTTYCVTVNGTGGTCTLVDCITITVGGDIAVSAGDDMTVCSGSTGVLSAQGGNTYRWSPAAGLSNPNIANPTVTPTTTTTYCVTVTDASGCEGTDCMVVNVMDAIQTVACEDKTIVPGGSIRLNVTSGASYNWSPASSLGDPTSAVPVATPSVTTTYLVTVTDDNGCTSVDDVTVFVDPNYTGGPTAGVGVRLRSKAFLQGSMTPDSPDNLMYDKLRENALIPEKEPYTTLSPFANQEGTFLQFGGGEERVSAEVFRTTGPDAIVDWIFLELHDAIDPSEIIATRSALLQRDGDIVDVDGYSPVNFSVEPGSYYVAVRHRNHLGAMTGEPILMGTEDNDDVVDFTNPATPIYRLKDPNRTSEHPLKLVGDYNCLWGGNSNANGTVIFQGPQLDQDKLFYDIFTHPENIGEDGFPNHNYIIKDYCLGDNNMDGELKYQGPNNDIDVLQFFNVILHEENPDYRGNKIIYEQIPGKE